jgi:RNA polymerase sigma-70 factor (ECF subfamily)
MVAADDELTLVARSQNGDHSAFEALINKHQRMIHCLCFRMTGSLADAQDLTQETFIDAYRHLAGFRAEARFSSWLYRIGVNRCLNWQKRNYRERKLHEQGGAEAPRAAESNADDSRRFHQVQEALMKLPPKQRAVIVLTVYDGMTHAEAARQLGCSETTVSWRLFAARAKLKGFLKDLRKPEVSL